MNARALVLLAMALAGIASATLVAASRLIPRVHRLRYRVYAWGVCSYAYKSEGFCLRLREIPYVVSATSVAGDYHIAMVIEGTELQIEAALEAIDGLEPEQLRVDSHCLETDPIEEISGAGIQPGQHALSELPAKAWITVQAAHDHLHQVRTAVGRLPEVDRVVESLGLYDLLVEVATTRHEDLADLRQRIQQITGVRHVMWATTNLELRQSRF